MGWKPMPPQPFHPYARIWGTLDGDLDTGKVRAVVEAPGLPRRPYGPRPPRNDGKSWREVR